MLNEHERFVFKRTGGETESIVPLNSTIHNHYRDRWTKHSAQGYRVRVMEDDLEKKILFAVALGVIFFNSAIYTTLIACWQKLRIFLLRTTGSHSLFPLNFSTASGVSKISENETEIHGCSDHAVHFSSDDESNHSMKMEDVFITEVVCAGLAYETPSGKIVNSRGNVLDKESLPSLLESLQLRGVEALSSSASSQLSTGLETKLHGSDLALNVSMKLKEKLQRQRSGNSTQCRGRLGRSHPDILRSPAPSKFHSLDCSPRNLLRGESSSKSKSIPQRSHVVYENSSGGSHISATSGKRRSDGSLRQKEASIRSLCRSDQEIIKRLSLSSSKFKSDY